MTTSSSALVAARIGAGFGAVRAAAAGKAARRPRDPAIAVILALSLAAHIALILPLLFDRHEAVQPPREIPVEIVQAPAPEPAARPAAKAEAPKPPPRQPAPQQQRPRPQPTPQEQEAAKQAAQQQREAAQQRRVAERMEKLFGAMPAIAMPGASDAGDEEVGYKQLVLSKVAKAKPEGRSRGIPGAASVSFTLDDQGEVARCEIVHKSVDPNLDAEAIAMIRRGAPYPPPPAGAQRDFVITLRFAAMP